MATTITLMNKDLSTITPVGGVKKEWGITTGMVITLVSPHHEMKVVVSGCTDYQIYFKGFNIYPVTVGCSKTSPQEIQVSW